MATRKPDTGLIRPYRSAPPNFREAFLRLGFSKELREELRTNDRCIKRWIEENGGDELRAERARISGSSLKPHRRSVRARNYVLGLRLSRLRTPTFFDAELMEDGK